MPGVAVLGATGRMGAALLDAIADDDSLRLAAAVTRSGHPRLGARAGGDVAFSDDPNQLGGADYAVDFALATGVAERAAACARAGCAWVVGTTGLTDEDGALIARTAEEIPVLRSANMSLAVNAAFAAAADLARVLGDRYDVDIADIHHRGKRDAPSGTALAFGEAIARARGATLAQLRWDDDGSGARPLGRIAFSATRAGRHAGEHRILFSGEQDSIELVHRAADRGIFARGALLAGAWLAGQAAGLYDMADFIRDSRSA